VGFNSRLIFIYAGYGLVVAAINKFKPTVRDANVAESELPEVSILIAAFNEEE